MHFSTVTAILAFATAAVNALPTSDNSWPPQSSDCNVNTVNKCCNGFQQQTLAGILSTIGLGCTNIAGTTCQGGTAACCHNQDNGLIVVDICSIPILS